MALCCRGLTLRILLRVPPNLLAKVGQHLDKATLAADSDILDNFTSKYLEEKVVKWERKKNKTLHKIEVQENCETTSINEHVEELRTFIKTDTAPPASLIFKAFSKLSQKGDKTTIVELTNYFKEKHADFAKSHSYFQHYLAEVIWVRGDITKSLELYETLYRESPYIRRDIRLMLNNLIKSIVGDKSEAVLVNVIHFCRKLLRDYEDYYLLSCVWQACFLSEWYTDQCMALKLLEENDNLCKVVVRRIPSVVFSSLYAHRVEVVYRLLEILLKYKMKAEYSTVLVALLDYQFQYGDLRRCSEIIRWSIDNEVELPNYVQLKIINKLLNHKFETPLARLKTNVDNTDEYNLKF